MPLDVSSYPVSLVLASRRCLVVGGGHVALRKVEGLLAAGATVTVVAPDLDRRLDSLPVAVERRRYEPGDAAGFFLVVAATGDPAVDHAVFADGDAAGVLVNAADDLPACSYILPAVLRRGGVSVAVSTDGRSPALAGWLRDRIAAVVGEEHGELADLLASARAALHAAGRSAEGLDWHGCIEEALEAGGGAPRAVAAWLERQLA